MRGEKESREHGSLKYPSNRRSFLIPCMRKEYKDRMSKDLPSNFLFLSRLQLCLQPSFALVFKLFLSKLRVDFLLLARGTPPFHQYMHCQDSSG